MKQIFGGLPVSPNIQLWVKLILQDYDELRLQIVFAEEIHGIWWESERTLSWGPQDSTPAEKQTFGLAVA